jgi:transcription antitermination factor NusG
MSEARWYAVYTGVRGEKKAALSIMDGLRGRGDDLAVYLPCETKWRRHARKREVVTYPLFTRYLFVFIREEDMYLVRSSEGVEDFVRSGPHPMTVPTRLVNQFRDMEEAGDFDETRDSPFVETFKAGEAVKVSAGTYADWPGKVLRMTGENRVLVLLSAFGREHEKELRTDQLKAA